MQVLWVLNLNIVDHLSSPFSAIKTIIIIINHPRCHRRRRRRRRQRLHCRRRRRQYAILRLMTYLQNWLIAST